MIDFTKKEKKSYVKEVERFGRKCPYCGSREVENIGHAEVGGMWARQQVECTNCREDWCEIYKLVDIERDYWED